MRIIAAGRSAIRHRRIFCSAAMTPSPALLIASATRAWPTARRLDAKKSLLRSREKVARAARLWCTTGVRGRDGDPSPAPLAIAHSAKRITAIDLHPLGEKEPKSGDTNRRCCYFVDQRENDCVEEPRRYSHQRALSCHRRACGRRRRTGLSALSGPPSARRRAHRARPGRPIDSRK